MIQRITAPPSSMPVSPKPPVAPGPVPAPPVTRVATPTATSAPTVSSASSTSPSPRTPISPAPSQQTALSRYEQTQKFLKDQILAVQIRSRDLKADERKMVIQSCVALGGSVVSVLVYVFLVLPLLIRFAGNLSSLKVFPQADTIPPRVPSYAAPVEATQEDKVTMTGFAEPKSKVVVVKNGQASEKADAGDGGDFSVDVSLTEGKNTIALYSVDDAKNESSVGKEYTVTMDKTVPEVDWQTPEDQKTVKSLREQTVEVKGKVNESAKVLLNDQFVLVSQDGNFSTTFQLQEGENKITLKVTDAAGNETQVERTVFFKP